MTSLQKCNEERMCSACYSAQGLCENDGNEIKIGTRGKASMNGVDWFSGVYVKESDIFCQYGVLRDDIKEIRFFTTFIPE